MSHDQHPLLVYIIAGEASGDLIGASLMTALEQMNPNIQFAGIGGDSMTQHGLSSLFPMQELSIMGIFEVIPQIFKILKRIKQTHQHIKMLQPTVIITIDAPGFNFRVVKKLKKLGIPLIHYVAPSVWAWRPWRAKKVAKLYDCLLTLFAFEPQYFTVHGLPTYFVGHPLIEKTIDPVAYDAFRHEHGINDDTSLICMLPGSRQREIKTLMPIFMETIKNLKQHLPDIKVIIPTLSYLQDQLKVYIKESEVEVIFTTDEALKYSIMRSCSVALASSGTVTLELALAQAPMVVAYKISKLTRIMLSFLIKIKWVALPNILSKRKIVAECLQDNCNSTILTSEMLKLLTDIKLRHSQIESLSNIRTLIQNEDKLPGVCAAHIILQFCNHK